MTLRDRSGGGHLATACPVCRSDLPDIGGDLAMLDELSRNIPAAMVGATWIPAIGPKRARRLFKGLDLASVDDLRKAAEQGRIIRLERFGERTQARILAELEKGDLTEHRFRRAAGRGLHDAATFPRPA